VLLDSYTFLLVIARSVSDEAIPYFVLQVYRQARIPGWPPAYGTFMPFFYAGKTTIVV
jgi:hypothetical protein